MSTGKILLYSSQKEIQDMDNFFGPVPSATMNDVLYLIDAQLNGSSNWSNQVGKIIEALPHILLAQDRDGDTPLHLALLKKRLDLAEFLADLARRQVSTAVNVINSTGHSPLHYAVEHQCPQGFRIQKLLLQAGANVSASDVRGRTVLHTCAAEGYTESLRLLLSEGREDPNCVTYQTHLAADLEGFRAVHSAVIARDWSSVLLLTTNTGVDIDIRTVGRGDTPLLLAATDADEDAVKTLLELQADPNVASYDGRSALSVVLHKVVAVPAANVVSREKLETIALMLIKAGADVVSLLSLRTREVRSLLFSLRDVVQDSILRSIVKHCTIILGESNHSTEI